jgi:hypothetical protein
LVCFEAAKLVGSSEFDPYRSKVAEEMLLCEIIVQYKICLTLWQSAYEGAVQQDCEASLARQLPTDCFDIQALCYFVCDFMSKHGMVDERIALLEEMYTRICEEEMGLQILCSRHCLDWRLLADSGGDLDRADGGLQWLLITYARTYAMVIRLYWKKAVK